MHRDSARRALAKAQHEQAKWYNLRRKEMPEIKEGDRVLVNPHSLEWIESKGEGSKLNPRWIGPFEVLERVNPKVFRLRLPDSYSGSPVINFEHLKKYSEADDEERTILRTDYKHKEESKEYEVERIIGHKPERKGNRRIVKFLTRWKGYGPQFDEWLTEKDMRNAPAIVREYKKQHGL